MVHQFNGELFLRYWLNDQLEPTCLLRSGLHQLAAFCLVGCLRDDSTGVLKSTSRTPESA